MRWTLLLFPALIAAQAATGPSTTCSPACSNTEKCVVCPTFSQCVSATALFTCGTSGGNTPPPCNSTCNGNPMPPFVAQRCWDGSMTSVACDEGTCTWVSVSCPPDPCSPSPCATGATCCAPTKTTACASASPVTGAYVCLPPATCQCSGSAPATPTTVCADGTLAGPYCPNVANCAWQVRSCPTDPCNPNPCTGGQVCQAAPATNLLGSGSTNTPPYSCEADPCAGVTCPGAGMCKFGSCYCDPSSATAKAQSQCANGALTPVFNTDPKVCAWVDVACPVPPPAPTCTGATSVVINSNVAPVCVSSTDPCVSPVAVSCGAGLVCDSSSGSAKCICKRCVWNGLVDSICFNGEPAYLCDITTCQQVPNPNCKPDPCLSIKCASTEVCMNMGAGISAPPVCIPKDPCNPNPCTDATTVCTANVAIATPSAQASSTTGANTLTAAAQAYVCVPKPTTPRCNPNPCHNGGLCVTASTSAANSGANTATGAVACVCQPGWKGPFCDDLACDACAAASSAQCASPNPVLSTNAAGSSTVMQSCVCGDVRYTGPTCGIVTSGTNGQNSPNVTIATSDNKGSSVWISGPTGTAFSVSGGVLPPSSTVQFDASTIVVDVTRLDDSGNSNPGPLPAGQFAAVTVCSPNWSAGSSQPPIYLVDATGVQDSKVLCASINSGGTVPPNSFVAPNCWKFTLCHASTYAMGSTVATSTATTFSVGLVGLALVLVV